MDPIASFQGLASGINFRDLVDQIIQAESRPIVLMEGKIADLGRKATAWEDFETRVQTLFDRSEDLSDGTLFDTFKTSLSGLATGEAAPLSASSSSSADTGSYSVEVLQMATKEKVGGAVQSDRTTALGVSGEFLIGGQSVTVSATDSLEDINTILNTANTGTERSGVSSAIVAAPTGGYRLVLTAESTGADGIGLSDGSAGALQTLGFIDSTVSIKNATSDGAKSDELISSGTAVGTLLQLNSAASDSVTIGGLSVAIDLAADSLSDIATNINTAASGAGSSVSAQVVDVTGDDGVVRKQLDISSTTSFTDASGILETLGVLTAGRSAVTQVAQSANVFTDGDASTIASGSTLMTDLWGSGVSEAVTVGDTLSLQGTRGDGTTFTKTFTVGVSSTLQDLADSLNSAVDGYAAGGRSATASVDATGALIVTDDTGGDSQLALSIVSNNEGGGTLDFGSFSTATEGRLREISAGVDAQIEVDGAFYSRSTNTISDVIGGVSLSLTEASSTVVSVDVTRDVDSIVSDIDGFMKAYNAMVEFVDSQFSGAGADGGQNRPLSGDGLIRTMRSQMRDALQTAISSTITDVANLSELGITLNREGTYDVDTGTLKTAIETDPGSVQRFFGEYGSGSVGNLTYVAAGSDTEAGAYAVDITTAASQGTHTGVGFGGTYVDDGTADTMSVTDPSTGSQYDVSLTNGMTMTDIVDALNTEFQTSTTRQLQTTGTLNSDAVGTAALDSTLLQDLYDSGGTAMGVADGDVLSISGAKDDGTSFFRDWTVTDVTTQTVADLRAEISTAIGTEVTLALTNGQFTATSVDVGRKTFTLAVSSDNAGGGSFSLGTFDAVEEGRGTARITASDSGGELDLTHSDYGSINGFTVAFTGGGTDGSASLGFTAGTYVGTDVVGTIGGQAATGAGSILTGDEGTAADGLVLQYTGTTIGAIGTATYSRGVASAMEVITDAFLDIGGGSIQGILDGLDTQEQGLQGRIEAFEDRLDLRAANLIKRFTGLEEALAQAQSQLAWLQGQLGSLAATTQSG